MTKQKLKKAKRKREAESLPAAADVAPAAETKTLVKKIKKKKIKSAESVPSVPQADSSPSPEKERKRVKKRQVDTVPDVPSTEVTSDVSSQKKHKLGKRERVRAAKERDRLLEKQSKRAVDLETAKKVKETPKDADIAVTKKKKKRKAAEDGVEDANTVPAVDDAGSGAKAKKTKTEGKPANIDSMPWREVMDLKNSQKVFVGGIPFSVDLDTLQKDFAECGEVWEFAYPKNEWGGFKGMAFFTFKTMEGVKNAMAYDGTDYWGRNLKVGMAAPLSTASRDDSAKGKGRGGKAKGKGKA